MGQASTIESFLDVVRLLVGSTMLPVPRQESMTSDQPMSEILKAAHMDAESARWDSAVLCIQRLLNHKEPDVRALAYRLMTLDHGSVFAVFGGDGRNLTSYPYIAAACGVAFLEGIAHFISYDIRDDGDPGIGYMRHDDNEGFTPCSQDHEDAKPYFHRCVEVLRRTVPDALLLDAKRALGVLDWYKSKRAEMREFVCGDDMFDAEDLAAFEPSAEERQLRALADELVVKRCTLGE